MKFLSPDALLVHASIKLHFSLPLVISQTKQNTKQRSLYMNSCSIRRSIIQEFYYSTFVLPIILFFYFTVTIASMFTSSIFVI